MSVSGNCGEVGIGRGGDLGSGAEEYAEEEEARMREEEEGIREEDGCLGVILREAEGGEKVET